VRQELETGPREEEKAAGGLVERSAELASKDQRREISSAYT
jgi:hypothetical protein